MAKSIQERLSAAEQDEKLVKLRNTCVKSVKMSRTEMSTKYDTWDKHNDIYRGLRALDKSDVKAMDHGEPEKMIVPMTFAQVQTYVAFVFLLYKQNRRFYELMPTGSEDYDISEDAEQILERDLRRNYFDRVLYQGLLDTARFGLSVTKSWWAVETQYAQVTLPASSTMVNGMSFQQPPTQSMQELIKFEGNRLLNVSPYSFFPDTRFPLSDWRRGAFAADETEWHINELKKWQRQGLAYGVEHIKPMDDREYKDRGQTRLDGFHKHMEKKSKDVDDQIVCLTTIFKECVPKDYGFGEEEFPIKYVIQIANDDRIIRAEPAGYLHDEYPYDIGQYSPDMHQQIGDSLADVLYAMQDVVSFLVNSRLASVRKSLENNLIVDPSMVDMTSVESRSPWILLKKGSARQGVDKFVRQLQYQDTTAQHLNDADVIMRIMQMVTGVNENSMGQFHGGRRSATEARSANAGAAARMKLLATVLWQDCYASLGRKMLMNSRQGISESTFVKILGESARMRYGVFHPMSPSDLVGSEDHFIFDSTLQSEKGFMAQSLQELVGAVLSNPIVMQVLPLDVGKLMEEILQLRGVDDIDRFRIQPTTPQNGIAGLIQGPGLGAGANGEPATEPAQSVTASAGI